MDDYDDEDFIDRSEYNTEVARDDELWSMFEQRKLNDQLI